MFILFCEKLEQRAFKSAVSLSQPFELIYFCFCTLINTIPVKNSPNSCSSFIALSNVFLACSSVSLLFMSLHRGRGHKILQTQTWFCLWFWYNLWQLWIKVHGTLHFQSPFVVITSSIQTLQCSCKQIWGHVKCLLMYSFVSNHNFCVELFHLLQMYSTMFSLWVHTPASTCGAHSTSCSC